jgi:hypothetical protein
VPVTGRVGDLPMKPVDLVREQVVASLLLELPPQRTSCKLDEGA